LTYEGGLTTGTDAPLTIFRQWAGKEEALALFLGERFSSTDPLQFAVYDEQGGYTGALWDTLKRTVPASPAASSRLRERLAGEGYQWRGRDPTLSLILYFTSEGPRPVEVDSTGLSVRKYHERWEHQDWINSAYPGEGEYFINEQGQTVIVLYPTRVPGSYSLVDEDAIE
jgi:hypothetical protein